MQCRMVLRVISGFRTISRDATLVLAGLIPLELHVEEKRVCHKNRATEKEKKEERTATMKKRQSQWETSEKGSWTRTLIGPLDQWLNRGHGDMDSQDMDALGHTCTK